MKMGFALPLALLLALPGLARAGGWVAELGAMAGKPQAPSQYTVDGSAAGGSIFAGYEDFKGIGLGLGFDYLGLSGRAVRFYAGPERHTFCALHGRGELGPG
jgi:hypothetical protein